MLDAKLTNAERDFVDSYFHEHMDGMKGPAMSWMSEHGLTYHDILSLVTARYEELISQGLRTLSDWPRPAEPIKIRWRGIDEFRGRVWEPKETVRRFLTERERMFAIGYLQEQWDGVKGPAFTWLEENGLAHRELQPFTLHLSLEFIRAPTPPALEAYPVPWTSVEEFRARAAGLRATLRDIQGIQGVRLRTPESKEIRR